MTNQKSKNYSSTISGKPPRKFDKISLRNIDQVSLGDFSEKEIADINNLYEENLELLKKHQNIKSWIEGALIIKYNDEIRARRKFKETGVISFEDDNHTISHDVPKKVDWDQDKLQYLADILVSEGEDPSEYIDIKYNVHERRYSSWPKDIQSKFTPARNEKEGSHKISISKKDK